MSERILHIFQEAHLDVRPEIVVPEISIKFFAFANVNSTIRMREGKLLVRISDLLEGAPQPVLSSLAHILLAKMYRKATDREHLLRYRRYVASHEITRQAHLVRQIRGRKRLSSARGRTYDLDEIFDQLNARFFYSLLARPRLAWSANIARNRLGHYDPAHNAIVLSRVFDHPKVPRAAVEYIVYHEMLHLKHPVKLRGARRCVHSAEFRAEEKLFPHLTEAKAFLRHL